MDYKSLGETDGACHTFVAGSHLNRFSKPHSYRVSCIMIGVRARLIRLGLTVMLRALKSTIQYRVSCCTLVTDIFQCLKPSSR